MTTSTTIEIGSRTSRLARWQAERVGTALERANEDVETTIVGMETLGDRVRDQSVPEIDAEGVFTATLERALLAGEVDCAVHSLKDLRSELPEGLVYAGSLERGNPADALVSRRWNAVDELPQGGVVATGSPRRRGQLRRRRPDLEFVGVRGNIGTRLDKLDDENWDGLIMAATALERLGRESAIAAELDPTRHVPAASQAAIGVEMADDRDDLHDLFEPIWHERTTTACRAERTFLARLEGGCTAPIGVYCHREEGEWALYGWVGDVDGARELRDRSTGSAPVAMAESMAELFLRRGAGAILDEGQ
ncbi:MAG: hydroxymethylbilane synthase [Bradymonadaceae bacterium]